MHVPPCHAENDTLLIRVYSGCACLSLTDESGDKVGGFKHSHQESIDKYPLEKISKEGLK